MQTEIATLKSEIEVKMKQKEKLMEEMNTPLVSLQSMFDKFKDDFHSDLTKTINIMNEKETNVTDDCQSTLDDDPNIINTEPTFVNTNPRKNVTNNSKLKIII